MEKYKDEFLELTPEEFAELLSYDELNIRSEGTFSKSEKSDFFFNYVSHFFPNFKAMR